MSNFKRVPITELARGMYVVDTQPGKPLAPPVFSVEGYILDSGESERLRAKGFLYAVVDEDRSRKPAPPPAQVTAEAPSLLLSHSVNVQEEIVKAQKLHKQAVDSAKAMRVMVAQGLTKTAVQDVKEVFTGVIDSLNRNENALLIMGKLRSADEYTFVHCVNVAMLAVTLGRRFKLPDNVLADVALAGFFHDIGKLLVPPEILNFPGKLSAEQYQVMQGHAELGSIFLEHCPQISPVVSAGAADHHERFDGQGYPCGKKGNEISVVGRILAVADIYDALSSRRCYKDPLPPAKVLSIMYAAKGRDFAPGYVEAFVEALGVYPTGSFVKLSNNYLAVVIEQCANAPLRPKVVTLVDSFGGVLRRPIVLDLVVHHNITIARSVATLPSAVNVEEAIMYAG